MAHKKKGAKRRPAAPLDRVAGKGSTAGTLRRNRQETTVRRGEDPLTTLRRRNANTRKRAAAARKRR